MTEIHHGLTGHGQIGLRNLVEPTARLHGQTCPLQHREVFAGVLIAAAAHVRQFRDGARLPGAHFPEHPPARRVTEGGDQPLVMGQRLYQRGFKGLGRCIHVKKAILRVI